MLELINFKHIRRKKKTHLFIIIFSIINSLFIYIKINYLLIFNKLLNNYKLTIIPAPLFFKPKNKNQ